MSRPAIKPNFDLAWERGYEGMAEGCLIFQRLREEKGWSRGEVWDLTDGILPIPRQELIEDHGDWPDLDELVALARIYEKTPGELLDHLFLESEPKKMEARRVADELLDRIAHTDRAKTQPDTIREVAEGMGLDVSGVALGDDGKHFVITYTREDIDYTTLDVPTRGERERK